MKPMVPLAPGRRKYLAGPLPAVRFCPTGGIGADNFADFLQLPNVACVGGSWVCPADAIGNRDWQRIADLAAGVHRTLEQKSAAD